MGMVGSGGCCGAAERAEMQKVANVKVHLAESASAEQESMGNLCPLAGAHGQSLPPPQEPVANPRFSHIQWLMLRSTNRNL